MDYKNYLDWMLNRGDPQGDYTLDNVKKLLEELGSIQNKIKIIHVAGTNGKGSVCSYIQNTLSGSNLKCGLFISPYIDDIRETIQINGEYISENDFVKCMEVIYPIVLKLDSEGYYATSFEIFVAVAFLYFYENKVDTAVMEVGMGGRFDATNIFDTPIATVITSISLDHINILGKTLKEIAWQKGGIIKDNVPVFIYPQKEEVMTELIRIAKEKNAPVHTFSLDDVKDIFSTDKYNEFSFREHKNMRTSLLGKHQVYNASLAIMTLDYLKKFFSISDDNLRKSISSAKNIGRIEVIKENPTFVLDGSHNAESIDALIENLKTFSYNKLILGFSVLGDKDIDYILKNLIPLASSVVLTTIDNPRAAGLEFLKREVSKYSNEVYAFEDRKIAFDKTVSLANEDDMILWCGSLYLIKDIRKFII
ncbi:bifunctional folylpolyglutamate synthase/dihydrofolate synthase [Peptoniphilus mikwangii]|uniref:bifunctional folylpolyglutamate synthase/dihydrofolate synthase n=1 Tax=Peptoniphilus mikwangii TaxID=1354300 RepID=UPI00040BF0C8|nr:folylpolyglutamate synthase/dihydrofolate synthase family protein [Peptoniphilus mikwangii]